MCEKTWHSHSFGINTEVLLKHLGQSSKKKLEIAQLLLEHTLKTSQTYTRTGLSLCQEDHISSVCLTIVEMKDKTIAAVITLQSCKTLSHSVKNIAQCSGV